MMRSYTTSALWILMGLSTGFGAAACASDDGATFATNRTGGNRTGDGDGDNGTMLPDGGVAILADGGVSPQCTVDAGQGSQEDPPADTENNKSSYRLPEPSDDVSHFIPDGGLPTWDDPGSSPDPPQWWLDQGPHVITGTTLCRCGLQTDHTVTCWDNPDGSQYPTMITSACPIASRLEGKSLLSISCMQRQCSIVHDDGSAMTVGSYVLYNIITNTFYNHIYSDDAPVAGPFVSVEDNGEAACGLMDDGSARCWLHVNVKEEMDRFDAFDPQPSEKYLALRPAGCGIRKSDNALVHVPELYPFADIGGALPSPPGEYTQILSCTVQERGGGFIFWGRALRKDGRIIEWQNDIAYENDLYLTDNYASAADTRGLICALDKDGAIDCLGLAIGDALPTYQFRFLAPVWGGEIYGFTKSNRLVPIAFRLETGPTVPLSFPTPPTPMP